MRSVKTVINTSLEIEINVSRPLLLVVKDEDTVVEEKESKIELTEDMIETFFLSGLIESLGKIPKENKENLNNSLVLEIDYPDDLSATARFGSGNKSFDSKTIVDYIGIGVVGAITNAANRVIDDFKELNKEEDVTKEP